MRVNSDNLKRQMRVLLCLVAVMWLVAPAPAHAAPGEEFTFAGEWEITFDINNGNIDADWIGRVWDYTGDEPVIMAHRRVDISTDCETFGSPVIGDESITFDGVDDYVRCQIPNYPAYFFEMQPVLQRCRCYYDGPPYVAADVTPVYSTLEQPVVYHDRIYLEVVHQPVKNIRLPIIDTGEESRARASWWEREAVRLDANNSLAMAKLNLQFLDDEVQAWQSNLFSLWQNDGYQIWAGYDAAHYVDTRNKNEQVFAKFLVDRGFWDVVQPDYVDGFFMWESQALASYTDIPMPSGFGLAAQSFIYIGHNPELGTYYHGTMRAVAVDPGCRGH